MVRFALALLFLLLAWQGGEWAQRRLSQHDGYWLVEGRADLVELHGFQRPRSTTLVLVDGLRADHAHRSAWYTRLSAAGMCWDLDVDKPSVSMPGYVSLSSGVESDRHGVRANGYDRRAVAVESIWQVARQAGLRVSVASHLGWWPRLFPGGFDSQVEHPYATNLFAEVSGDLRLIHPLYVDETGHHEGGASPAYRAAAERADAEIGAYLDGLDLSRDLVVITADHGHADAGGHGGMQAVVRRVTTCAAGASFRAAPLRHRPRARHLASFLAIHLGVAFPRHALADQPDAPMWDSLFAPEVYLAARRSTWLRFATDEPVWPVVYAGEAQKVWWRGVPTFLAGLALLAFFARPRQQLGRRFAWMLATVGAFLAVYVLFRGSLDGTSIRFRENWVGFVAVGSTGVAALAALAHRLIWRDRRRALDDLFGLGFLVVLVDMTQAVAFGWPMGFPLPAVELMFLPFLTAALLLGVGLVCLVLTGEDKVRS